MTTDDTRRNAFPLDANLEEDEELRDLLDIPAIGAAGEDGFDPSLASDLESDVLASAGLGDGSAESDFPEDSPLDIAEISPVAAPSAAVLAAPFPSRGEEEAPERAPRAAPSGGGALEPQARDPEPSFALPPEGAAEGEDSHVQGVVQGVAGLAFAAAPPSAPRAGRERDFPAGDFAAAASAESAWDPDSPTDGADGAEIESRAHARRGRETPESAPSISDKAEEEKALAEMEKLLRGLDEIEKKTGSVSGVEFDPEGDAPATVSAPEKPLLTAKPPTPVRASEGREEAQTILLTDRVDNGSRLAPASVVSSPARAWREPPRPAAFVERAPQNAPEPLLEPLVAAGEPLLLAERATASPYGARARIASNPQPLEAPEETFGREPATVAEMSPKEFSVLVEKAVYRAIMKSRKR
ncbi:MAG: hypothetical protein LBO66_01430 [Deltaproteobacteria bacterium]|jgi:hypothetical protein|nr:hypothetical protein [Deltaproteobacteria bacterium]